MGSADRKGLAGGGVWRSGRGRLTCAYHAGVDEIHITGSDKTHDLIVWGPPGPAREERK